MRALERIGWLMLAAAAVLLVFRIQQRGIDARDARAKALEERLEASGRVTDSLTRALARQLPEAQRTETKWRDRWRDSIRWDTLWRPAQLLFDADSAGNSCTAALGTCVVLADSLRRDRDDARELVRLRHGRAWTAAGLSYDPRTGTMGAFVDRDLWRLRLGASVGPDPIRGGRAELRAGWRW